MGKILSLSAVRYISVSRLGYGYSMGKDRRIYADSGENGEGIAHVHSLDGYGLDYAVVPGDDLSNGDVVTLTLSAPNGDDLEKYCAERYGFIPISDFQKYVVADLEP